MIEAVTIVLIVSLAMAYPTLWAGLPWWAAVAVGVLAAVLYRARETRRPPR